MLRVISIILSLVASNAYAIDQFYQKKAEGWFWYEELKSRNQDHNNVKIDSLNPIEVISNYQQQLEFSLKQALVKPTITNVATYLKMQQQLFNNANYFANTWKRTLMYYPELDPTVKQPISHLGGQIYLSEERKNTNQKITEAAKDYGLLFFFQSRCIYCHEFAKTVKNFAAVFGWEVLPISLDGKGIPEFPEPKSNNGISGRANIYAVPALILTNPSTGQLIPITYGLISEQELIDRVSLMLNLGIKK